MPLTGESTLVDFDGDAATAAAREVEGVLSVSAFTSDDHEILYVADEVLELYEDEQHLRRHYAQVLSHLEMDILEREVYEESLLPNAGPVRGIVTHMAELTLLRIISDKQGLYLALAPDTSVPAVIDAVEDVVGRPG
ncbi:hypothetical protein [Halosegnis sp.]|uniref:hypothetical protein n=1 Tax=Halosegnis sp. TaxID=2864959 RepID=UPI0035D42194